LFNSTQLRNLETVFQDSSPFVFREDAGMPAAREFLLLIAFSSNDETFQHGLLM